MEWLSPSDPSSFSRPDECIVTHLHLDLDVDFDRKVLRGSVLLHVGKVSTSAQFLTLDTRELSIKSVKNAADNSALEFKLGEIHASFGSPLIISLPTSTKDKFSVIIEYSTTSGCTALQWMTPEQTAGKKHPYMFSQCQAIHARSMVPCQDSPGIKMPYTATIRAPHELVVLMSAIRDSDTKQDKSPSSSLSAHHFIQKVPVPSYLIAIVVGALESRVLGPRSKVWSEKEMVDASAYEFAETEKMLSIGEELLGPYEWGIYDLLVLPPSFPYGGMENPCLTFITPTLIAGDRSLALVVAHELTHSWMGNLITNRNPEHFWLNEGHTVFVERKIAGRMMGEKFRHMLAGAGWNDLQRDIGGLHQPFTHLVPALKGVDPDDAFSIVPYEKGSAFLMYLEQLLGGPAVFEPFLMAYVKEFKFKSIVTDDWKAFLYKFFSTKKSILDNVDWNGWFHSPGMPLVKPTYDTSLADALTSLANKWGECSDKTDDLAQFKAADFKDFSPYQMKDFIGVLLELPPLSAVKIKRLGEVYNFDESKNCEIKFRWLRLCLRAHVESAITPSLKFVTEQGRMKFVRPIYRDMYGWDASRQKAIDNYTATKLQMHPVTATMVGRDLKIVS